MNIKSFQNPPKKYREVPFWSWNDRLETDELLRQIKEMDDKGWGGFFMHSRKGLVTPYLSEEWMDRVRECIEEANRRGLGAWLYDEDKWPSGFCGGKIPLMGAEYRQKALLMREDFVELPLEDVQLLKAYAARKHGKKEYSHLTCIDNENAEKWKKDGYTILYFYKWTQPIGPNRFNNTAWVDLLNPRVTDAFIESTHEVYRSYVGSEFGNAVPGIFTDESTILYWAYAPKMAMPWSEHFESYFIEENGYDIREKLPYLFINLDGFEKVRYDYWKVVTGKFVENYVKRIYDWCEKYKLKYTGHFMAEDYFEFTMQYIGSLMPAYEYMHIPGVDHLNRNINDIMTVKQVTSVSHQLGKERTLCEMFGCSGQNFSFEHHKWIADWNLIHGINLINSHLSLYTMRGERKRDYPPNLFYQQPWWEHNKQIADYSARLSYILSKGKRLTDILLVHSIESAWCCYNPADFVLEEEGQFDTPDTWIEYQPSREFKVNDLSYKFDRIMNTLLKLHYDFDLGDETIIAKHGKAEDGLFKVGQGEYRVVIVPPAITLRKSTAEMLLSYAAAGGTIIFIDSLPTLLDGSPDNTGILEKIIEKSAVLPLESSAISSHLDSIGKAQIRVVGENNETVWYHLRRDENDTVAFFANTDKDKGKNVRLFIRAKGHPQQLDPFTGNVKDIPYDFEDDMIKIDYSFPPAGSLLIAIDGKREMKPFRTPEKRVSLCHEFGNEWAVSPLNKNSITLDYCSVKFDGKDPLDSLPVLKAGIIVNEADMDATLTYAFDVDGWDGASGELVVESPQNFDITVNKVTVNKRFGKNYWVDKSFRAADIRDLVKQGTNTVELKTKSFNDSPKEAAEIEAVYVLGDFTANSGDRRNFKLCMPEMKTASGNLVLQGYPFYTGKMSLSQKFIIDKKSNASYLLELDQNGSIASEVIINGNSAGTAIVRPYVFDITPFIRGGENNLEIILTTSLHNLLGPHHSTKGEIIACAPASFRDEKTWTDAYCFVELGLGRVSIKVAEE